MKSVIQKNKECYFCKTQVGLECHHIFEGTGNRPQSEKYGFKVYLCHKHHNQQNGAESVHFNKDLDIQLKQVAQRKFEETHTREEFIAIFGRNYL